MIVKTILITFILLAGCAQQMKPGDTNSKSISKSPNLTKIDNTEPKKDSTATTQQITKTPKMIQAKSKIYQSLQSMGITAKNVDFFFHSDPNLRKLMQEKLINTRNPYHLHLVWQKIKEMLDKDQWRVGFNSAITVLWNSSNEALKKRIIDYLLAKPKLSKVGRAPWTAAVWLSSLKLDRKHDLQLLEILKINQHPSRQWVRNYLSKRYKKNFGSNYLIWKQHLEQH